MTDSIEERLRRIEERNARVELDKRWETSWTRRAGVALVTYVVVSCTLMVLGHEGAWLHSIVPVIGFLLSTLALRFVRRQWVKRLPPALMVLGLLLPVMAHAEIKLTLVGPLSGSMAAQGDELQSGANAAVAEINASGLLNDKLAISYEDDACNATQATSVANKVVAKPPVAVIGHLCSAATLAAAPIYGEAGLPQLTFSSNTAITESGWKHLFRLVGRDDRQAPDLVVYIMAHHNKDAKIAVLDDKGSWGLAFADMAAMGFGAGGYAVTVRDSITSGQKDFSSLITKLKTQNVNVVVMGLYVAEAALLVRQAREQGFTGEFFGGDPIQTPEFAKIAGPAADGVKQTGLFNPASTEQGKKLVEKLHAETKSIGIYTYYAYAAVQTMAEAIKQAGSTNKDAIIAALRTGKFPSMLGTLSFDGKGDVNDFKYHVYEWKNGDVAEIAK